MGGEESEWRQRRKEREGEKEEGMREEGGGGKGRGSGGRERGKKMLYVMSVLSRGLTC